MMRKKHLFSFAHLVTLILTIILATAATSFQRKGTSNDAHAIHQYSEVIMQARDETYKLRTLVDEKTQESLEESTQIYPNEEIILEDATQTRNLFSNASENMEELIEGNNNTLEDTMSATGNVETTIDKIQELERVIYGKDEREGPGHLLLSSPEHLAHAFSDS